MTSWENFMKLKLSKAFTMIEMMVVLFIIGMIMALVVPRVAQYMRQASETQMKLKMANVQSALTAYRMEFGSYPTTREGLQALVENLHQNDEQFRRAEAAGKWPFVVGGEKGIEDEGHNPFIYNCPVEKYKNKYRLYEIIWVGKGTEDEPQLDFGE
jgi:general secretion pathway protein G